MKIVDFQVEQKPDSEFILALTNESFKDYQGYSERLSQIQYGIWQSSFFENTGSLRTIYKQDLAFLMQVRKIPFSRIGNTPILPKNPVIGDFIKFPKGFGIILDADTMIIEKVPNQFIYSFVTTVEFDKKLAKTDLKPVKYPSLEFPQTFLNLINLIIDTNQSKQIIKIFNKYRNQIDFFIGKFASFNMYQQNILFYSSRQRNLYLKFFEENGYFQVDLNEVNYMDNAENPLFYKQLLILNDTMINYAKQLFLGFKNEKKVIITKPKLVLIPVLQENCLKIDNLLFMKFLGLYQFIQWHTDIIDIEQINLIEFIESFYWQQNQDIEIQQIITKLNSVNSIQLSETEDNLSKSEIETHEPIDCFYPFFNHSIVPYHFKLAYNNIRLLVKGHILEAEYIHNNYGDNSFEDEEYDYDESSVSQQKSRKKISFSQDLSINNNEEPSDHFISENYHIPSFIQKDFLNCVNFNRIKKSELIQEGQNFLGTRDDLWADLVISYINQTATTYQDLQAINQILPLMAFLTSHNVQIVFDILFRTERYLYLEKKQYTLCGQAQYNITHFPYKTFQSIFEFFNIEISLTTEEVEYFEMKLDYNSIPIRQQYQYEKYYHKIQQHTFQSISLADKLSFYEWLFYQVAQSNKQAQYEEMIMKWIHENEEKIQTVQDEQQQFFSTDITKIRKLQYQTQLEDLLFKKIQFEEKLLSRPNSASENALQRVIFKIQYLKEQNLVVSQQQIFKQKLSDIKDDQQENIYKLNQGFICEDEAQFYACNINQNIIGFAAYINSVYFIPETKIKLLCQFSSIVKSNFNDLTVFKNPIEVTSYPTHRKKWINQEDCMRVGKSYTQIPIFLRTLDDLNLSRENSQIIAKLYK
ncbi:hypothetical protein SS50377_27612 [Spironucleus salmonicida]|uniref:Uncharacterized protein n=1 Tax=Spironucleus salmonicida TaxID=348837 RepID=V6M0E9_9EUKA|nr:hypothetical protein SS50377_27612 [Spironucleus salmonicida]|eukprot:EST46609.1 Hypothetical protein SS50377_13414 [Spironucleus salmonicida]